MRALRAPDGCFVAVRHDDEQVNIAVIVWIAPGVRTVKPDLLRLEFGDESSRGCFEQSLVKRFHAFV